MAESYDELIELLHLDVEVHVPAGDCWALFGHSMGALLGYGLIRRRRDRGLNLPCAFIASGCPAPSRFEPGRFDRMTDDDALIADLHRQGGTPLEVFESLELLEMTLDALRADYRVCGSYRHVAGRPLPVAVQAFAGRDDAIAADRLEAWRAETSFPVPQGALPAVPCGWMGTEWFDGGHFFIRQSEDQVLAAISRTLGPLRRGIAATFDQI